MKSKFFALLSLLVLTVFLQTVYSQSFISPVFTFDTKSPVTNVVAPNGGQTVNNAVPLQVTWTATDDNLKPNPISIILIIQPGNNSIVLAQNLPNTGSASVNLPAIITTQAKIKVVAKDMFGNEGVDESNGFFSIATNNLIADFIASDTTTETDVPVQFTNQSTGNPMPTYLSWDFGDNSPISTEPNPVHQYQKPGTYNVTLTVSNGSSQIQKIRSNYINVNATDHGIELLIEETGLQNVVKWVGYEYINFAGHYGLVDTIEVINHEAHITWDNAFVAAVDFNDEIILFSEVNGVKKQVGHIKFEYDHQTEKRFNRHAILIFHNDAGMSPNFPYGFGKPGYDLFWTYYKSGEYPVSMLIPPDNTFPTNYDKPPLLFVHGINGSYSYKTDPDARPDKNEVSYWFTTVKNVNSEGIFQAWQYYYPYDTDIPHLGLCLKEAVANMKARYPNNKIGIITHSMGGLVTSEYITSKAADAKQKVKKVLYLAPPFHGSLGSNKAYKKALGAVADIVGPDENAPATRDLGLGSEFIWNLCKRDWVDLNDSNGVSDDYFVLTGTTKKFYGLAATLHRESFQHDDGIVSISSASLTEKGIGFATFHGNHDDAVHAQSKVLYDPTRQNIGNAYLLPEIIKNYFTMNQDEFLNTLTSLNDIKVVVSGNRQIIKPTGKTWDNLTTDEEDVNYQRCILNFRLYSSFVLKKLQDTPFNAFYNQSSNSLIAARDLLVGNGYELIGTFLRNKHNDANASYFFCGNPVLKNGCALDFNQGEIEFTIQDFFRRKIVNKYPITLNYCETKMLPFDQSYKIPIDEYNDQSDLKRDSVISQSVIIPDSLTTCFFINPEDTVVGFRCTLMSNPATGAQLKLKSPDGVIHDSTSTVGTYSFNPEFDELTFTIPNPAPGKWYAWIEVNSPGTDSLIFDALVYLQSGLHAFIPGNVEITGFGGNYRLAVGLQMDSLFFADSLFVRATVYPPNSSEQVFDLSMNVLQTDTSEIFFHTFPVDSLGYYTVKYNLEGIYNGYRFERALYQKFEAVDTIPLLNIPDVELRPSVADQKIKLKENTFNLGTGDSIAYTAGILSSNVDTATFSYSFDTTLAIVTLNSNLSDTGTVVMRFTCSYPDGLVEDTILIRILLPDLCISNQSISDTILNSGGNTIINYSLNNVGTIYSGAFEVGYYLSGDSLFQTTDLCIGSKVILNNNTDTSYSITDTLQIPLLNLAGHYHLILYADAGHGIIEINDSNNTKYLDVYVNGPPAIPFIINALPGDTSVQLIWHVSNDANVSGYMIYYDTDTIPPFDWLHTTSGQSSPIIIQGRDTTHTITGLYNDTTYYFSVSSYNVFGIESQKSVFDSATPHSNIPGNVVLQGINILSGQNNCYQALQTINVAGGGTAFMVQNGGIVNMVAGTNILIHPIANVVAGGYFRARIAVNNQYCSPIQNRLMESDETNDPIENHVFNSESSFFRIYPNPTTGKFTITFDNKTEFQGAVLQIFNMLGGEVTGGGVLTNRISELSLQNASPGIYIIKVIQGNQVGTAKMIRQ